MGPLSAIGVAAFGLIFGLNGIGWITASPKVLGIFALIGLVALVLIDTFWHPWRWTPPRRRVVRQQTVAASPPPAQT